MQQLAKARAKKVLVEDAKKTDAVGQKELKCVLSMQVIMAMRDSGYDAHNMEQLAQIAQASTYLVHNHHVVDFQDQKTYKQAIALGLQCLTMGTMRLQRNYSQLLANEDPANVNQHVDLRVLGAQHTVDVTLKVHPDIVHPFSRPQLLAEMGQHTPRVERWYKGALMIWAEAHALDSAQGSYIMDRMAQGQHTGRHMLKDLKGFPPTQCLAQPATTTSPVRALLLAAAVTASIKVIRDDADQGSASALIGHIAALRDPEEVSSENEYTDEDQEDEVVIDEAANVEVPDQSMPLPQGTHNIPPFPSNLKELSEVPRAKEAPYKTQPKDLPGLVPKFGKILTPPNKKSDPQDEEDEAPEFGRRGSASVAEHKRARSCPLTPEYIPLEDSEPKTVKQVQSRGRDKGSRRDYSRAEWGAGIVGFKFDFVRSSSGDFSEVDPMVMLVEDTKGQASFPKGQIDDGESRLAAGLREWREETSLSRRHLNVSKSGAVMHMGISYFAGIHILNGKDTGGRKYSWPIVDGSKFGKKDIVKASWVLMSEVKQKRLVMPGRIEVMEKCWQKVINDKELHERSVTMAKEAEVKAGDAIDSFLLGGQKRGRSPESDKGGHTASSSKDVARRSCSRVSDSVAKKPRYTGPGSLDTMGQSRSRSRISHVQRSKDPGASRKVLGVAITKDGEYDEMKVDMVPYYAYVAGVGEIEPNSVTTRTHYDVRKEDKPGDAPKFVQICKAFNDERKCKFPCLNKHGQPSAEGDKAHVCDVRIPIMPQWILDLPAHERMAEGVSIKYRVCASSTHSRQEHFDHQDGIVYTKEGKYAWLLGAPGKVPQNMVGRSFFVGRSDVMRWGGVA